MSSGSVTEWPGCGGGGGSFVEQGVSSSGANVAAGCFYILLIYVYDRNIECVSARWVFGWKYDLLIEL